MDSYLFDDIVKRLTHLCRSLDVLMRKCSPRLIESGDAECRKYMIEFGGEADLYIKLLELLQTYIKLRAGTK